MNNEVMVMPEQAQAWLSLAAEKNKIEQSLQSKELALQQRCINVDDDNIDDAIVLFKKGHKTLVDERLFFTNLVNSSIIEKLMVFEKRTSPKTFEPFLQLEKRSLQIREGKENEFKKQQELQKEIAAFKCHFQNEFERQAYVYRCELNSIVEDTYIYCVDAKTPIEKTADAILIAKKTMDEVTPTSLQKFDIKLLEKAKAKEIFNSLYKPNFESILNEYKNEIDKRFLNYDIDTEDKEELIKHQLAAQNEAQLKLEQTLAANNIMGKAESFIMPDENFKPIKEVKKIVIKDELTFVIKIMNAFLFNFNVASNELRVKKLSQLNIAQMAAALDAIGVAVDGVDYEIIKK
jgi:hypothetical protein